jgi:hypothetical protein
MSETELLEIFYNDLSRGARDRGSMVLLSNGCFLTSEYYLCRLLSYLHICFKTSERRINGYQLNQRAVL